jgi:dTDP-4-dehydrorhamnose 3,5-epimerase
MKISQLAIDGAYLIKPDLHEDKRGIFLELFSQRVFQDAVGHPLGVTQLNCSLSRHGTIRGIHAVAMPPGQSRYIACVAGAITDIVVDIRVGSPTFGEHIPVTLDAESREILYLAEGQGHGFAPLTDEATVIYMCSSMHAPDKQIMVNALDPALALPWPQADKQLMSEKDRNAPTLRDAQTLGLLPDYTECRSWYAELRATAISAAGDCEAVERKAVP